MRVYRREHERRRRAVGNQLVDEQDGEFARVRLVGEAHLARVGIALEPVHELLAERSNDVELRVVHVAVDHARDDQLAREVLDACVDVREARSRARLDDVAVFDEDRAVGEGLERR